MLDMKFLDPVLELFDKPTSALSFRLDLPYGELHDGLNCQIEDHQQMTYAFDSIELGLKKVTFKLCIIYSDWLKGNLSLTDEQIIQTTIGLNYEIEEVRYRAIQLGLKVLPSLKVVSNDAFNEYKKLLLQYLYGAHLTCPERFVTDIDLSVPSGYTDQQIQGFRNRICVPHIRSVEDADYTLGTVWTKEDIDGYLDNVGVVDSVHPCIPQLVKFCQNVDWIFDDVKPDESTEVSTTSLQKTLLCLLSLLPKWADINLGCLLKDEQTFTVTYDGLNSNKKQQIPYSTWRDAEITRRLSPTVNISATLN